MPTYAYRENRTNGTVERVLVAEKKLRGEPRPHRHWSEKILRDYYNLECQKGSRFSSGFSKDTIKRVHETAIQRFEQTGEQS